MNYSELLQLAKGWSNFIFYRTIIWRLQINNYYRDQITRFNIDGLTQPCTVLNCVIDNLLDFVSPEEKNEYNP